ncbi:MAG: hypothetical protein NTW19_12220 [Planctomycetota bacterium]|nr:hypothetical protein [Planctomycetota bacterium]
MAFTLDDSMINHYWSQGYLIFRGIVPPTLLRDLRAESDKARELVRARSGPQVLRTPLVKTLDGQISMKPFQDYLDLPELVGALERLFGPGSRPGSFDLLQVLLEPKNRPVMGGWHRDGVVGLPMSEQHKPEQLAKRAEVWHRPRSGNQVNCAIYSDSCLWYVPGSHLRMRDLAGERQSWCFMTEKYPYADSKLSDVELERTFIDICRAFPGAMQAHLAPGDYMVYRSQAWHTGVYAPTQPRATIHDIPTYDWSEGRGLGAP